MQACAKMSSIAFKTAAPRGAPARSAVVTAALPDRRAVLFTAMLPALVAAPKAWALIPDEEDEELVERAKANRAERIKQQRATTNAFLADEGLANRALSQDLIPVQKAVYKLLEGGDVSAASRILSESWVGDFSKAAAKVSGPAADPVVDALSALATTAGNGDLTATKQSYVKLVDAVQAWASTSGLAASLKGL